MSLDRKTAGPLRGPQPIAAAICGVFLALSLGGCGFQPLYGENNALNAALEEGETTGSVTNELSQIAVVIGVADDADGRGSGLVGFETRSQLIDLLGATAESTAKYDLRVRLTGIRRGLAVQSDASVTRFNYFLRGAYRLVDNTTGTTILTGESSSFSAYNVVDSEFATVTARRDAEFRAARNIAEDLKLQLALFFKSGKNWRGNLEDELDQADELPSYKKGSPRLPDDRPVGAPAPEDGDTPES